MYTPHPILDTSNAKTVATVEGSTETSMSSLPLGKAAGGEVYLKVGGAALADAVATGLSGGSGVTPHFKTLGATASQVVPSGAKGYMATILTGTGTIGGEAVPAGVSVSSSNALASSVTIATDADSSAFIAWEV